MAAGRARVWFITGATRGFGAEIAKAALAAGDLVAATGRDPGKIEKAPGGGEDRLLPLALDVTDRGQTEAAVDAAVARFGGIDVLVNNAGYGHFGVFEELDGSDAERQFATNVFGVLGVTRAVLPVMRRQRSGRIFNLSSIAGVRGGPGGSLYCASKHALEGFSESLSEEVKGFGIHVTLVEPGFFRTDFLDPSSVRYGAGTIADYTKLSALLRSNYDERNHRQAGDPVKLADGIVKLADADAPPMRWAAGTDAVKIVQAKIERLRGDLETWRELSVSTDGVW